MELFDSGKITKTEMLDKARNPGQLLEKADAKDKREGLAGEEDDYGPIIGG